MSSDLQSTITALAQRFAADVLRAMRGASLEELRDVRVDHADHADRAVRASGRVSKKRIRRSPEQLEVFAQKIIAAVVRHPDGIKAEDLKRMMGVAPGNVGAKVFTKPLSVALKTKKIGKRGARRGTTYFAK